MNTDKTSQKRRELRQLAQIFRSLFPIRDNSQNSCQNHPIRVYPCPSVVKTISPEP